MHWKSYVDFHSPAYVQYVDYGSPHRLGIERAIEILYLEKI